MSITTLTLDSSSDNAVRQRVMPVDACCLVTDVDRLLLELFQEVAGDQEANLCTYLSTRRHAFRFMLEDINGSLQIQIAPDSGRQVVELTICYDDVQYDCRRSLGQSGPYGGVYEGVKRYPEIGMVPISDSQVAYLLRTTLIKLRKRSDWRRQIVLVAL